MLLLSDQNDFLCQILLKTNSKFFPGELTMRMGEHWECEMPDLGKATVSCPENMVMTFGLPGNCDGDEEDDDDLHEAWDEDARHQGEDLWRLHDPGVRG